MRNNILKGVICGLAGILFAVEGWAAPFAYVTNNTADGLVHVIDTAFTDPAVDAVVDSFLVASAPVRILLSPDGRKAFVSNSGSGSVSIADLVASTVTAVKVGLSPLALAVTPDGKKLYVVNNGGGTVSVIDVETATEAAVINVGGGPKDVKITPDGKTAVVVNETDGTAVMIDTATNTASSPVTVGDTPGALEITPDGTKAYVANSGTNLGSPTDFVSVINLTNNQVSAISVGDKPQFVAVTPDGTRVLVANVLSDTISIIDTTSDTVLCLVAVGNGPSIIVVDAAGTRAYVSDTLAGAVSVVDIAGCAESPRIIIAGNAQTADLAITPDGAFVYAVNRAIDTISVISTADNTIAATILVPMVQVGPNSVTPAPWVIAMSPADTDEDGYGDPGDNCPTVANSDQADADGDGAGDLCDDEDSDGVLDINDNCPTTANPDQADADGNGVGDACDVTGSGGGSSNGGLCFIATAAFGSPMEPQVQLLREFRDRILNAFAPGRAFVRLYERYSPPLAGFIAQSEGLRAIVRTILWPLIGLAWIMLAVPIWVVLMGGFGLIGLGGFLWFKRPR